MCRCWVSQAACWRQFLNIWTSRGLSCATSISAPHMLSTLFRPQVRTHSTQSSFLCMSLSLCLLYHVAFWLQMQVSLAFSVASRRSFCRCFPSPCSPTLRAQLVCRCRSIVKQIQIKCEFRNESLQWWKPSLGSYSTTLWEATAVDNQGVRDMNSSSSRRATKGDESTNGVLNPTACLHLGDIILFTVNTRHYPQYDL